MCKPKATGPGRSPDMCSSALAAMPPQGAGHHRPGGVESAGCAGESKRGGEVHRDMNAADSDTAGANGRAEVRLPGGRIRRSRPETPPVPAGTFIPASTALRRAASSRLTPPPPLDATALGLVDLL